MRWSAGRWAWIVASGLAGLLVGAAGAALGTEAGRAIVVREGLAAANAALAGRLTIAGFDGTLLTGLEVRGLRITDTAGAPLAEIERLRLRYRLRDLLRGRVVLGQLSLEGAAVTLVEGPDGRFNYQRVLRLGEGSGDGGPGPLIAFNDVVAERLAITIRTADGTDRAVGVERGRFPYVRIASPLPAESAVVVEIRGLQATLSDPALDVRDARGRITVAGDSVHLAFDDLRLPETRGALHGPLFVVAGGPFFRLDADLARVRSDDVRGLVPLLPPGFTGRARVRVVSDRPDVVTFTTEGLALTTPDGGRARGRLGMVLGPGESWRLLETDLQTTAFDVQHLRALLDTVPFAGTLTGRTRAAGPRERISATIDWQFADARVSGRPVTTLVGDGLVALGVPGDLVFQDFAVRRGRIPLATVRALVPAIALQGTLEGAGTLTGPWQEAAFSGTLRHTYDTLPPTVARGVLRVDARGDTVGVWADLGFDSLQLEAWRPSYPAIPLVGAFAGDFRIAGYFDALDVSGDLSGPLGRVRGHGVVVAVDTRLGVRDLDLRFDDLALEDVDARLPGTRVSGTAHGMVVTDSGAPPALDLALALDRSRVGGAPVDSARASIRTRDSVLDVDSARVWAPGTRLQGAGRLALGAAGADSLTMELRVDSLAAWRPLLERVLGVEPGALVDTLEGRVDARLVVRGAARRPGVDVRGVVRRVRWDAVQVPTGTFGLRWTPGDDEVNAEVALDSVGGGRMGLSAVEGRLRGQPDSLRWQLRSRLGEDAAFVAGGRYAADSLRRTVAFDSLVVLLVSNVARGASVWFLDRDAQVELRDTAVTITGFTLAPASGAGRLAAAGVLPLRGPGDLRIDVERLPVPDVWALLQYDPERAGGELGGQLVLSGTARAPELAGAIALDNGVFGEFRAPRVEWSLDYRAQRFEATGVLWRLGEEIMRLEVRLPLDLAIRGARARQLPGPLTVRARADGVDLAFLEALYPETRNTRGRLFADFGIAGTWERPVLTGEVVIRDGAATFPAIGVRHERLNGRIELSNDTIHVRSLAVASGTGTAELAGFVRLEGLTRPRLGLTITARDFRAVDIPEFLSATVSGDAELRGPVYGAVLRGRATVPRGVLWFADIVQKDIINLEDTLFADVVDRELLRRQGLGRAFQNRFLDSLRIDSLGLEMGSDVWLRSGEANIQLTGPVLVNKVAQSYRLDGVLQTPRGTYRLPLAVAIEREFTVTRGEVRYFGTPDLNAALDIDARHQLRTARGEPVTIAVHIGGTIQVPTLELSSDVRPPLSDTEIISYLLVGAPSVQAGSERLAGRVGQQLVEQIAARVTGQLTSALIADLSLPLDYFEVRPELGAGGGTEIAIGRQFGQRVFATLSPRICPQQEWTYRNVGASIEFRVSEEFRLSASADPVSSCRFLGGDGSELRYQLGFDLLWEKNYR